MSSRKALGELEGAGEAACFRVATRPWRSTSRPAPRERRVSPRQLYALCRVWSHALAYRLPAKSLARPGTARCA